MGYSVKWVNDKLGITRNMIRDYEAKGLLPVNKNSAYRNFSDEDIEKLWNIKLLIGIGFTIKEIYALMNEPDFDFDTAIAQKVAELERKHDEDLTNLNFAKTIKLTGQILTTSQIGSTKFDEFLEYARKNWNLYSDPRTAPFMEAEEIFTSKKPQEWSPDDVERILEMCENLGVERMTYFYAIHAYCQVISDMKDIGYDSDTVQRVVKLLYKYFVSRNTSPELDGKTTPQFFARHMASTFLGGDVATRFEEYYGKEECIFIAKAVAYYGGYDIDDL